MQGDCSPSFVLIDSRVAPLVPQALAMVPGLRKGKTTAPEPAPVLPIDDATVLLIGRGAGYPALSVALGEQMGVVGALSIEAAAMARIPLAGTDWIPGR